MVAGKAALDAARMAVESTYTGKVTVTEVIRTRDEKTKLMKNTEDVVLKDIPCGLSFEAIKSTDQTESYASVEQITKLFISPDVRIHDGSKLTVTQDGVTTEYVASGTPATYQTHQEIMLKLSERYA